MSEEPILAVIKARFDLGFIVETPNGQTGQLRVSEMSTMTSAWDRSLENNVGIGNTVAVYEIQETDDVCLFSEFSAEERFARDQKRRDWINALGQAEVGSVLTVRIEHKFEWGCVCRQETQPFLEGVIVTHETAIKHQLPLKCITGEAEWEQLEEKADVPVIISHKQWASWRHVLYFSLR